jgi:hypothetical protein
MRRILSVIALGAAVGVPAVQAQTAGSTEPAKPATTWADKVSVKGDVRFRYETIDEEGKDTRTRERVRVRAAVIAKPTSELETGIGLSTSEDGDPVSSNVTLGDGGSRKDVYFDLMYLDYHPESVPGLRGILGKQENPFVKVSDLVYDNDYNPESAALKYKFGEDDLQFLANGAVTFLEERSEDDDTMMYGAQAAVKLQNEKASYVQGGASWYLFDNMEGFAPIYDPAKGAKGNSTTKIVGSDGKTNSVYATDFSMPELFLEAWMNSKIPVGLYANYVVNTEADSEDTGYLLGLKIGKIKDPGSWSFDYNFRHLEKDAVVGQLTDSDSFGGGTDGEGHRVSASYQVAKNLTGTLTYFMDQKGISGDEKDYDRLQIDLMGKF